jgi:hypothetical protein
MRELVFALEFRGRGEAVSGSTTLRQARSTAPSQAFRTALAADGIHSGMETIAGEAAVLESRVERFPDGSFIEDGTITYGRAGRLTFDTVGRGYVGPSPQPGRVHGTVMWRVTGGDGRLAGAQGLITSNFTVTADGEVIDDHFTRLFLPD